MSKKKIHPVLICFACNDENGNLENGFSACTIGDEILHLESYDLNPRTHPHIDFYIKEHLQSGGFAASRVKGTVGISRRRFPIIGYKSYWGNIIWNLIIVDVPTAKEIVTYLHSLKKFTVESGSTVWFDKWNSERFEIDSEMELELAKYGYQKP